MTRPAAVRGALAAVVVVVAAVGLAPPSPARAAESGTRVLPGRSIAALAVDVDGSGDRDLLRLVEGSTAAIELDVWREEATGWVGSDRIAVPAPDHPEFAGLDVAAGLIEARQPDGLVPLLVVAGTDYGREFGPTSCCLAIHRVRVAGGEPTLHPLPTPALAVDEVFVLDLDGDAVDELVVGSSQQLEARQEFPLRTYSTLRWDGAGYTVAASHEVDGWSSGSAVGDIDGLPGDELILLGGDGRDVVRLAEVDGAPTVERTTLPANAGWLVGMVGSHLVMGGVRPGLYAWPRDGELGLVSDVAGLRGDLMGVVGEGDDALLLTMVSSATGYGFAASYEVYDARLELLGRIDPPTDVATLERVANAMSDTGWSLERSLWPYTGPTDWSTDASDAWIVPGHAIAPGGPEGFRAVPMLPLIGIPVGHLGDDDGWIGVCDGCWRERARTGLFSATATVWTGQLALTLADELFAADPDAAEVAHPRAVVVGSDPRAGVTELLANRSGFDLHVMGDPLAVAVSFDGNALVDHGPIDEDGVRVSVRGPSSDDDASEESFERTLILIGPDGRFTVRTWRGTFAPAAPTVTADMWMTPGSLEAEVTGVASVLGSVTVDGRPVPVDAAGGFRATVDAPPWPRSVIVTVTDPFGAVVERSVEVIGLVDYRGLPWGLIAIVATLGVAAVLFLRVPHMRGTPTAVGDGTLEELDAHPR